MKIAKNLFDYKSKKNTVNALTSTTTSLLLKNTKYQSKDLNSLLQKGTVDVTSALRTL